MNVLSLFSGIGGLELGLERAGMTVVGQVELDPFCQRVLAKHWPEVPRHDDVRTCVAWWRSRPRPPVHHVVAGGFPCQDVSSAGRRAGIEGKRSGLWTSMAEVIRELRPNYVVVENVVGLVRDPVAFGWILGDLAELGFDAEWGVLSACSFGAPHTRERLFLVAYSDVRDGRPRLGGRPARQEPVPALDQAARAWRDRVDGAVAASRSDDREADELARQMVAAGGNSIVPDMGEYVGRLIMAAAGEVAA